MIKKRVVITIEFDYINNYASNDDAPKFNGVDWKEILEYVVANDEKSQGKVANVKVPYFREQVTQ